MWKKAWKKRGVLAAMLLFIYSFQKFADKKNPAFQYPLANWSRFTRRIDGIDKSAISLKFCKAPANRSLFYSWFISGGRSCESTRGSYRVRVVDYWNKKGRYSSSAKYPSAHGEGSIFNSPLE